MKREGRKGEKERKEEREEQKKGKGEESNWQLEMVKPNGSKMSLSA